MSFIPSVKSQYELGDEIQQFIDNCKKAPIERRTLQFYNTKIAGLQALGDRFHKAHGEILQLTDKDMTDEYFTTKHYEKISNSFIEYLKTLERKARELEDE